MTQQADFDARQRALATDVSFIVQAPAGSGKTELLTQRFLVLLAQAATKPEQILAITFTNKAASEMRDRVIKSLQNAMAGEQPETEPALSNWRLSKAVLARDKQLNWNLIKNPNRLRIQTIDGLCASINYQLPLVSELGGPPEVSDQTGSFFKSAALSALEYLDQSMVQKLLLQLNNDLDRLAGLIAEMLKCRDQWLPHIMPYARDLHQVRQMLESSLQQVIEKSLSKAYRIFKQTCQICPELKQVFSLLTAARECLKGETERLSASARIILNHSDLLSEIKGELAELNSWLALVELLTTQSGQLRAWRKPRGINKSLGFPSDQKENKKSLQNLLEALEQEQTFLAALDELSRLPHPEYSEQDWALLSSLLTLLPVAVACLKVEFKTKGCVDFCEVGLGALRALEGDDAIDIAEKLDDQIQHILVDEFQDTSITQFELLRKLTRQWHTGDGRTLFLVGDPMQSIYRFRQADVGLFLAAKDYGIGDVSLEYLRLTRNFRSHETIIQWVNRAFNALFPDCDDWLAGAVSYSESFAVRSETRLDQSRVIYQLSSDTAAQEQKLVESVEFEYHNNPQASIAILVRNRTHIQNVMDLLNQRGIPTEAVEIHRLAKKQVIQDLASLTKAMVFLEDRLAWLSILRAPWCGLKLADLLVISEAQDNIWLTLSEHYKTHFETLALSGEAKARLLWLTPVLIEAIDRQRNYSVSERISRLWSALNANLCYSAEEHRYTQEYFNRLDTLDSIDELDESIETLYTNTTSGAERAVQIMTIHKSKGLEFDVVFLPFLEKSGRRDDAPLLHWAQVYFPEQQKERLILANLSNSKTYRYLQNMTQEKADNELIRLLYVAATRARDKLYLTGSIASDETEKRPVKNSFLYCLYDLFETEAQTCFNGDEPDKKTDEQDEKNVQESQRQSLRHLRRFGQEQFQRESVELKCASVTEFSFVAEFSFKEQDEIERLSGTLLHQLLQYCETMESLKRFADSHAYSSTLEAWLLSAGLSLDSLPQALHLLQRAIGNMLKDDTAHWILSERSDMANEMTIIHEARWLRVDRTFLEAGERWIIDYKLASIALEKYRKQLEDYARAFRQWESRPIRLGLYCPLTPEFRSWVFEA